MNMKAGGTCVSPTPGQNPQATPDFLPSSPDSTMSSPSSNPSKSIEVNTREGDCSSPSDSLSPIPHGKGASKTESLDTDLSSSDSDADQVAPSNGTEMYEHRAKQKFSKEQLRELRLVHRITPCPTHDQFLQLANRFDVDYRSIKVWFNNRRPKIRTQPALPQTAAQPRSTCGENDEDVRTANSRSDDETVSTQNTKKGPATDKNAPVVTQYQQMSLMALPPDHPFCQLGSLPSKPAGGRARRAPRQRSTDSPVARPAHARGRSHQKKPIRQLDAAPPSMDVKPEVPQLWRPIDAPVQPTKPTPPPKQLKRPTASSSPLDLSVSLKRKRDEADDATTLAEAAIRKYAGDATGQQPTLSAGYPMVFPGGFPFYSHPAGGTYLPMMPQMPFQMPHLPLGLYGQPLNMWGTGVSGLVQSQKPVR